jgi:hypothetical protein
MKLLLLCILSSLTLSTYAVEPTGLSKSLKNEKTFEEKEQELINYKSIQEAIKSDGLEKQQKQKAKIVTTISKERLAIAKEKFDLPADEFWSFMTELWLVKNAQSLSWDYPKPDLGIDKAFKGLLEKLGFYNIKFKILIMNTPNIVHFGLPGSEGEFIFILSHPFMRSLDLTKVDISLLLLEDLFRLQSKYFISNIEADKSFLGLNFQATKFPKDKIEKIYNEYSNIIYKKGFNFQQQYEITKKMDMVLKADPLLWATYFKLLKKIDGYVKTDLLYKSYLKIYPSPELQLKWLSPKENTL